MFENECVEVSIKQLQEVWHYSRLGTKLIPEEVESWWWLMILLRIV